MQTRKINLNLVRRACRKNEEIKTITRLAALIPCSRPAVYFAIETPSRFPVVYQRINELLAFK